MTNDRATVMLRADKWPCLVMIVLSTIFTIGEELSGCHPKSCLSEREWSTNVRLTLQQPLTNSRSAVQQSVALIVRASHQSSQDLDTRAYGIALARFATAPCACIWTQLIWTLSSICTWAIGHVCSSSFVTATLAMDYLSHVSGVRAHQTYSLL